MSIECEYCTGSRWLSDLRDLGPCVCCTPENMAALEARIVELEGPDLPAPETPLDSLRAALAELDGAILLVQNARESLDEATREVEGEVETLGEVLAEAKPALQAHLVHLGFAAEPTRTGDDNLDRLADLLIYGEEP